MIKERKKKKKRVYRHKIRIKNKKSTKNLQIIKRKLKNTRKNLIKILMIIPL